MMCTIYGDSFYMLTNHTWIDDSGTSCHITNDNTDMFDVEQIDGSSENMKALKRGRFV